MDIYKQQLYSGTSGLVLPVANKTLFPEAFRDKSRLTYYGSLFNSLEINSSFKKVPMIRTVEKWAASVPADFRFTFKLSKGITHNKGLAFNEADVYVFLQTVDHAGDKKACLLVQFPGKLTSAHMNQLEKLLAVIRQTSSGRQWRIAVEFRNTSWYNEAAYALLAAHQAVVVAHDMPPSAPPPVRLKDDFAYLRFHGPERGYRGSYTNDFLYAYAQDIRLMIEEGKQVFVYFNNTLGGAADNLLKLNEFVSGSALLPPS